MPLVWAERACLAQCRVSRFAPCDLVLFLALLCEARGPLRVNVSALEAAGQFTLLPGLYKNTSFEVWGEAVKGKTWWRIKPGVGLEYTALSGSLLWVEEALAFICCLQAVGSHHTFHSFQCSWLSLCTGVCVSGLPVRSLSYQES